MSDRTNTEFTVDGTIIEYTDMTVSSVDYYASVSKDYRIIITAIRSNFDKDFLREDYVTKIATLSFTYADEDVEYSGLISDFDSSIKIIYGNGGLDLQPRELFTFTLIPEFFGKKTRHNKVYLDKSVVDIAHELVEDYTGLEFSSNATGGTTTRDYCLQHQSESDREFFDRILSEEGIYYYFNQEEESITLDDSTDYTDSEVIFELTKQLEETSIHNTSQMTHYYLHDHNPESPTTPLAVDEENSDDSCFMVDSYAIWPYPGSAHESTSDGSDAIEKLFAGENSKSVKYDFTYKGYYNCFNLTPCSKFKIKNIQTDDEVEYTATSVHTHLSFSGTDYRVICKISAIDSDVLYTPELIHPPSIPLMPAEVIGDDDTQRNHSEAGVQVKFYWQTDDDDDDTSCYLRVAQLWAGKSYGTFFRPVIGTEVIVSFLYGPNRAPVIIGCLHDTLLEYPYEDSQFSSGIITKNEDGDLPTEVIFDDTEGEEKFTLNTAYDFESTIQNDRTINITEGNDSLIVSKGNKTISLDDSSSEYSLTAGTINIEGTQSIVLKCGDSSIEITSTDISMLATMLTAEGSATAELSGGGTTTISGGIVKIN